jgi:pimeloyl-ACP methyl ester carboxylesterase
LASYDREVLNQLALVAQISVDQMFTRPLSIVLWILLLASSTVAAQDYAREKRWADEVVPAVVVGDPVWLELKGGHKFLNLFAEQKNAKIAILLVHGVGVHPDHGVIGELRTRLHDQGYTTLSVQMPVAKGEGASVDDYYPALFPQAGERISVAARFLQSKGYKNVVLASHSMGAWMSNVYLTETETPPFNAWISMGLTGRYWGASLISIPLLGIEWFPGKIQLPVLDVYGENDISWVLDSARQRARALAHIPRSEQVMIKDTDHHYAKKESELVDTIHRFIGKITP